MRHRRETQPEVWATVAPVKQTAAGVIGRIEFHKQEGPTLIAEWKQHFGDHSGSAIPMLEPALKGEIERRAAGMRLDPERARVDALIEVDQGFRHPQRSNRRGDLFEDGGIVASRRQRYARSLQSAGQSIKCGVDVHLRGA